MKKKKLIILITIILCTAILATTFVYTNYSIDKITRYDMHVMVSEDHRVGFNVGTDKIWFGRIPPGEMGKRTLILQGNKDIPVKAIIRAKGELANYISLEDNHFIIKPNTTREVEITVLLPSNATRSVNMTGTLEATFYKHWR